MRADLTSRNPVMTYPTCPPRKERGRDVFPTRTGVINKGFTIHYEHAEDETNDENKLGCALLKRASPSITEKKYML